MHEVADGIYALAGLKMGRAYLIDDADGLTLIDTSSASASAAILDAITAIRRKPEDLRTIVVTHYHYDHTGNVSALVDRSGAEFCAHAEDVPYIDGRLPWLPPKGALGALGAGQQRKSYFTLKVDRVLHEGDTLPAAGGLKVVHAPGHTPGHIALHSPARRVLFAGDAFMNVAGLHPPAAMSSHDMDAARESIRRLGELDFDIALPGHGQPVVGRASEKLREYAKRWLR